MHEGNEYSGFRVAVLGLWLLMFAAVTVAMADQVEEDMPGDDARATIGSKEWRLDSLTVAGEVVPMPAQGQATLQLQDDDRVGGVAFLNRFFGTLAVEADGVLRWGQALGSTKMAGPPELMELERVYLSALPQTERWRLSDDQLSLESADGGVLLQFVANEESTQ